MWNYIQPSFFSCANGENFLSSCVLAVVWWCVVRFASYQRSSPVVFSSCLCSRCLEYHTSWTTFLRNADVVQIVFALHVEVISSRTLLQQKHSTDSALISRSRFPTKGDVDAMLCLLRRRSKSSRGRCLKKSPSVTNTTLAVMCSFAGGLKPIHGFNTMLEVKTRWDNRSSPISAITSMIARLFTTTGRKYVPT